jgi:hypothetical protein
MFMGVIVGESAADATETKNAPAWRVGVVASLSGSRAWR